jgi:hypothetical protein
MANKSIIDQSKHWNLFIDPDLEYALKVLLYKSCIVKVRGRSKSGKYPESEFLAAKFKDTQSSVTELKTYSPDKGIFLKTGHVLDSLYLREGGEQTLHDLGIEVPQGIARVKTHDGVVVLLPTANAPTIKTQAFDYLSVGSEVVIGGTFKTAKEFTVQWIKPPNFSGPQIVNRQMIKKIINFGYAKAKSIQLDEEQKKKTRLSWHYEDAQETPVKAMLSCISEQANIVEPDEVRSFVESTSYAVFLNGSLNDRINDLIRAHYFDLYESSKVLTNLTPSHLLDALKVGKNTAIKHQQSLKSVAEPENAKRKKK